MAIAAFAYLAINGDGCWYKAKPACRALFAFLLEQTRIRPDAQQIADFRAIIAAPRPSQTRLEEWFRLVYTP